MPAACQQHRDTNKKHTNTETCYEKRADRNKKHARSIQTGARCMPETHKTRRRAISEAHRQEGKEAETCQKKCIYRKKKHMSPKPFPGGPILDATFCAKVELCLSAATWTHVDMKQCGH